MTSQEIIDKLTELDIPTSVAQDQNNDPYTLLEKINYVLSKLDELIARDGTQVKVAGIVQKLIDFVEDPQDQITNLTDAVALNVEGIAHMNEIKQDKLSQTDLDNIAGLNQLQDKLDAKASKTEVNSLSMCPSDTHDVITLGVPYENQDITYKATHNGYLSVFYNVSYTGPMKNFSLLLFNKNNKMNYGVIPEILKDANDGSHMIRFRAYIPVYKNCEIILQTTIPNEASINFEEFRSVLIHAKEV